MLDRGVSARSEKGTEIGRREGGESGEARCAAAMLGQEIEELREVAAIGRDRMRRGTALGLQPAVPLGNRVLQIGLRGETRRIEGRGPF